MSHLVPKTDDMIEIGNALDLEKVAVTGMPRGVVRHLKFERLFLITSAMMEVVPILAHSNSFNRYAETRSWRPHNALLKWHLVL